MGKLFYLMTFLAQYSPEYYTAADTSRRALLETEGLKEDIKVLKDRAERELYNYTGLTPAELAYAGYIYPVLSGNISTKPFKNFKYDKDGILVIPELEYNINNGSYTIGLFFKKSF